MKEMHQVTGMTAALAGSSRDAFRVNAARQIERGALAIHRPFVAGNAYG